MDNCIDTSTFNLINLINKRLNDSQFVFVFYIYTSNYLELCFDSIRYISFVSNEKFHSIIYFYMFFQLINDILSRIEKSA